MQRNPSYHPPWLWISLAVWTALNLVQAACTELFHDEAYYWLYSLHLSLGYFDHAPGIGLLIRAGTEIFPGELGVRFFIVLLNSATLYLLWLLARPVKPLVFLSVAGSMLLFHLGGFFAAPDAPASFSLTLTLLATRRFLERQDMRNGLFLAVAVALVCWSKYQAVVLVLLLALACFRVWRSPYFWMAVILALLLYLPHVLWVVQHKLSMFSFYLRDRGTAGWGSRYLGDLLAGSFALLGPLLTPVLLVALVRFRTADPFLRSVRLASGGFILFLILLCLRSPVESNWIAPAGIPLLLIGMHWFSEQQQRQRFLPLLFGISLPLLLVFRLYLAWNFLPAFRNPRNETHGWKDWALQVDSAAAGNPVVFVNSYQHACKFWFYTGHPSVAVSNYMYRKSQMDLMGTEADVQGKRVYLVAGWDHTFGSDTIRSSNGLRLFGHPVDDFHSNYQVRIEPIQMPAELHPGDTLSIPVRAFIPGSDSVFIRTTNGLPLHIGFGIKDSKMMHVSSGIALADVGAVAQPVEWKAEVRVPLPTHPGDYSLWLFVRPGDYIFSENSGRIPLRLK